jgi:UDP-N-acetyl-D-mannosaminuronate dehydrogenase/intein/homing endonuclease
MSDLRKQLLSGQSKVGIWGTGYIGFSTMANFAAAGVSCLGTDVSEPIVSSINQGQIPVPNMEYWLGFDTKYLVDSHMMSATTDWKKLLTKEFPVHMISIPTEKGEKPWDGALEDVITKIASNYHSLNRPSIVVIESTLTPNKTDNLIIPILKKHGIDAGTDIILGVAPRRDWFISPEKNLKTLPRIVGGTTPESTREIINILNIVCDHLIPAPDHRHAEIVKSVENAYRHVEITLANQLSLAYPNLNMTEVLKLVGTKWNVGTYHPSFGTGGYCLGGEEYVVAARESGICFTPIKELYGDIRSSLRGKVKVLSFKPKEQCVSFKNVTAMSRRISDTLSLNTVGNHGLTVTPNHIMYLKRQKLWKRLASGLHHGDELAFIDRLPYFKYSIPNPYYVRKGRGRTGHLIDLEHFAIRGEFKRKIGSGRQRLSTGMGSSYQTLPRFLKIDQKLAFLIGLYAAEGSVTKDRSLRTYITLHYDEADLISIVKETLQTYGVTYSEYDDKSTKAHQIRISSNIWGRMIQEMTGGRSDAAKLPEFLIFWHDKRVRKSLLSGLLNGDGSVLTETGKIKFYTKSKILQQQTIYLLRSFGLTPTLNRSSEPATVRLAGRKAREFAKSVLLGRKLRKLESYAESRKDKDPRFSRKESRRPRLKQIVQNGREVVYSLEVEGTHNFFTTSGLLVHNCIPLSSKYVLEGAQDPDRLTILKDTILTDESLPVLIADRIADSGFSRVGILGLSYKGDLKVHILSPTLRISKRLMERGVTVKVNDPYYSENEIKNLTGADSFIFPTGLSEFDCVVIVAGHRLYRAVPESQLKRNLTNCRLVIDNLEETWKYFDWAASRIRYLVAGDKNWILNQVSS